MSILYLQKTITGISRNNDIYHFPLNQRKYTMKGAHSGLLRDEMEIPISPGRLVSVFASIFPINFV